MCQQLLQLDEVSILSPPVSVGEGEEEGDGDMEQQVLYARIKQADITEMSTFRVSVFYFLLVCHVYMDQSRFI